MRMDGKLSKLLQRLNAKESYDLMFEAIDSYLSAQKLQLRIDLAAALKCESLLDTTEKPASYAEAYQGLIRRLRTSLEKCLSSIGREDVEKYEKFLKSDQQRLVQEILSITNKYLLNSNISVATASQVHAKLAEISNALNGIQNFSAMKAYLLVHVEGMAEAEHSPNQSRYIWCIVSLILSSWYSVLVLIAGILALFHGLEYGQKWFQDAIERACG